MEYLIYLIITIIFVKLLAEVIQKSYKPKIQKFPFRRRDYLLTVAEKKFYDVLKIVADQQNYIIMAKVRLEDLLWLPKNTRNKMKWRGYVKSRHIDFVLCDKYNVRPILAIELDDSSHNKAERIERDQRVNQILKDAQLPIVHIKNQNFYNEEDIRSELQKNLLPSSSLS